MNINKVPAPITNQGENQKPAPQEMPAVETADRSATQAALAEQAQTLQAQSSDKAESLLERMKSGIFGSEKAESNPLSRLDKLVSGLSLRDGVETWKSIKEELDASGIDYRTESVEYKSAITRLFDEVYEKGDPKLLGQVVEIFGQDALTPERKQEVVHDMSHWLDTAFINKTRLEMQNEQERSAIAVELLSLAGWTNDQIADYVYNLAIKAHFDYFILSRNNVFSIVPGLEQRFKQ
jgi:hypothetical protein